MNRGDPTSIWQEPLGQFAANVASSKPVPGGGAVAALSACLAASLLRMVLEISAKAGANVEDELAAVEIGLKDLQPCVEDDIRAFNSFLAARKMPQFTEAEKQRRQEVLTQALLRCTEVPLAAVQAIARLVPVARDLVSQAPDKVLSDLGVALAELDCALVGLSFTVSINLRGTDSDPAFAAVRAQHERLAAEISAAHRDLAAAIDQVARKIGPT